MKNRVGIAAMGMVFVLGASLAEASSIQERTTPKRIRRALQERQFQEREKKERVLTLEQIERRKEAAARRRERFQKWVVSPIKKLRPHRHPGPPSEAAAARRREAMKGRFDGLVPHRYPAGQSTDPATGTESQTNIQPAVYTTEETK